jgi:transcriptional regulator with XRE-family HTH domain
MRHGPAVRRRRLGEELRRLRLAAGLTSRDAARLAGWHQSKISRMETGVSGVKAADAALLLDVYQVADPQPRSLLETLTGGRRGGGAAAAVRG